MGFLSRVFKPVSKVLDKIIPNEIKPALPYMAAFAPFIAPGIMGTSVMQRALMGGGLNILGQLSQEGNEGDINLLSAGLGALSSAMTAPGSGAGGRTIGDTGASYSQVMGGDKLASVGSPSASQFFKGISDNAQGQTGVLASGKRFLGNTLAKGSDIMTTGIEKGLFSKEGLKAATLPASTATGDVMMAEAKRAEDAYQDALAAYEAEMGDGATDAGRALAIRTAMEAYGFLDDEIEDTIAAAGYKAGGRVGLKDGTEDPDDSNNMFFKLVSKITPLFVDEEGDYRSGLQKAKFALSEFIAGKGTDLRTGSEWYNKLDDDTQKEIIEEKIKYREKGKLGGVPLYDEEFAGKFGIGGNYANGGRIGFDNGGSGKRKKDEDLTRAEIKRIKMAVVEAYDLGSMGSKGSFFDNFGDGMEQIAKPDLTEYLKDYMQGTGIFDKDFVVGGEEDILKKANGGRVGFRFGGIDSAVENIENQDVKESMKFASATSNMDIPMMEIVEQFELKFKRKPNSLDELKQFYKDKYGSQNIQEKLTETVRTTAAEGGLMNLGGKEMDMRTGGFIPIGKKERADDVPARLSKNEFVMTADAVRAAGGGSVNKGAKRMYEVMNKLEARA